MEDEDKKQQTIEEAIDSAYNDLFDLICEKDVTLHELKIVYQDENGKTITRSWKERNDLLKKEELENFKMEMEREKARTINEK